MIAAWPRRRSEHPARFHPWRRVHSWSAVLPPLLCCSPAQAPPFCSRAACLAGAGGSGQAVGLWPCGQGSAGGQAAPGAGKSRQYRLPHRLRNAYVQQLALACRLGSLSSVTSKSGRPGVQHWCFATRLQMPVLALQAAHPPPLSPRLPSCPLPQARGQYLQYHDKVVASQQYKQVSCGTCHPGIGQGCCRERARAASSACC